MEKEKNCSNCKHTNKTEDEFPCSVCVHRYTDKYEPVTKTNYDRIKSMSVEEMAEFFEGHFDCNFCPESERLSDSPLLKYEKCDEKCIYHITQWLLQEVSEND